MNKKSPWAWVPTLYFAEGLPYVAVMTISLIMYKRLGLSNAEITLYTSWLYLPWVIKPLWSPFIDIIKTKRWWIVVMQLLIGGFCLCQPSFRPYQSHLFNRHSLLFYKFQKFSIYGLLLNIADFIMIPIYFGQLPIFF